MYIGAGDIMKFIELKCKNCGAKLEVEEGTTQVTCKFCDTTFSIDDAYTQGYKDTKGVLKAHDEQMEKDLERAKEFMKNNPVAKTSKIITIVAAVIFVAIFCFVGYGIFTSITDNSFDVDSFNTPYEVDAGKRSGFFLASTLDDIVTNNKTNKKHIITVSYKDVTTTDEAEIKKIRNGLSSHKNYDVSLDYDSKGYVNKFTIADIETDEKDNVADNTTNNIQIPDMDDLDTELNNTDYDKMKEEVEQQLEEIKEKF